MLFSLCLGASVARLFFFTHPAATMLMLHHNFAMKGIFWEGRRQKSRQYRVRENESASDTRSYDGRGNG